VPVLKKAGKGSAMRVVYFISDGIFSPVLDSQAFVPLRLLGEQIPGISRSMVILTSLRHCRNPEVPVREAEIMSQMPGVRVHFKQRLALGVPFEAMAWSRHLDQSLRTLGYDDGKPVIIHCRGDGTAVAAARLKKQYPDLRVLLDMRGDQGDEIKGGGLMNRYLRHLARRQQVTALRTCDGLNTVSNRMAQRLCDRGLLRSDIPRSVVGCCIDTERFYFDPAARAKRRQELGIDEKFVVCYCGAMSHWQRPDAMAQAYAAIRQSESNTHFLIISRESELLVQALQQAGIPDSEVTVRSARHQEVVSYLTAGDVGLLLRDDTVTNQVASPVKFAEYLRCGVPVILTPYVGDFGGFAVEKQVGQTVTLPLQTAEIQQATRALRSRLDAEGDEYRRYCSDTIGSLFSWTAQIQNLVRVYHALHESKTPPPTR
jgi:glycosyltransferase involved in cell wall biosynthesis